MSTTCNFSNDEVGKAIRDRIVIGIRNEDLRRRLLDVDDLELDKAVQMCQRQEVTQQYAEGMRRQQDTDTNPTGDMMVAAVGETSRTVTSNFPVRNCGNCGGEHQKGACPAYGKQCRGCGKSGHFVRFCRSRSSRPASTKVHAITEPVGSESHCADVVFSVGIAKKTWSVNVTCEGKPISFKVDTGATCNILTEMDYRRLHGLMLIRKNHSLRSYSGHAIPVIGTVALTGEYGGKYHVLDCAVVKDAPCSLLGLPSCVELGLVAHVQAVDEVCTDVIKVFDQYSDVFTGLGRLPARYTLQVKPDSTPVIQNARRVPFRLRDKLKNTLAAMENLGAITKVREATEWVHPIVTVLKPNGDLRVCLDPSQLNKCIKREHFSLPTASEIFSSLSGSTVFSTLDATSGFLQLELDEDSSKLTTFATPFGRYRFLRLPFGISSAPEVFHRTVVELFGDLEGVEIYIDDLLVHGKNQVEHDARLLAVLERCRKVNLRLNQKKCKISQQEIKYLGHIIRSGHMEIDPGRVAAILAMPKPDTKESLSRFLSTVQYSAKFLPNLSDVAAPLWKLTSKDTVWAWERKHEEAWSKLKDMLSQCPALALFDPNRPVTLLVDACQHGMGAVLLHEGQPVEYASCSLTPTQQRYSQIEKEYLAVQYGLLHFHQYVFGQKLIVETDHRPLLGIMNKGLTDLSPRLLRMRLRNQRYDYELRFVPEKLLVLADTLSRAPLPSLSSHILDTEDLDSEQICAITEGILPSHTARTKLATLTASDPTLQVVSSLTKSGWPSSKAHCPTLAKPYWKVRADLTIWNGILIKANCLVIPAGFQKTYLSEVHKGHLGLTKCLERMKTTMYWPGCSGHLGDLIEGCAICQSQRKDPAHTFAESHEVPSYPMQQVATDLFHFDGQSYLLTVDRYSKWPDCHKLEEARTGEIVEKLQRLFVDFGRPEILLSDNGPQFTSYDFQAFLEDQGVRHITSSPMYAQSNGLVERMVQTVKNSLKKALMSRHTLYDVLTTLRSTPIGNGLPSPAVLLQSRNLRDNLHNSPYQLQHLQVRPNEVIETLRLRQGLDQARRPGLNPPTRFVTGQLVYCRQAHRRWVPGQIIGHAPAPSSYYVRLQSGQVLRRNYSFLSGRQDPRGENTQGAHTTRLDNNLPAPDRRRVTNTAQEQLSEPSINQEETSNQTEAQDPSSGQLNAGGLTPTPSTVASSANSNNVASHSSTPVRTSRGRLVVKPARFRDGET